MENGARHLYIQRKNKQHKKKERAQIDSCLLKGQNYLSIGSPREENGHTDLSKDKYITTCKDFMVTL